MGIIEGRGGQPMMKALPVDIIQSGDRMMQSFYFQQKEMLFPQPPFPPVLGIEITGICVPVSIHQFLGIVCLGHAMVMCRHSPFCQGTRFGRQRCQGKTIEAHCQIGFASEHHFVVGRKTKMNRLSHGIPSSIFNLLHTTPLREPFASSGMLSDALTPCKNCAATTTGSIIVIVAIGVLLLPD